MSQSSHRISIAETLQPIKGVAGFSFALTVVSAIAIGLLLSQGSLATIEGNALCSFGSVTLATFCVSMAKLHANERKRLRECLLESEKVVIPVRVWPPVAVAYAQRSREFPLAGDGPSSLGASAPPSQHPAVAELPALVSLGLIPVPGPDRGGAPLVVAQASVAVLPLFQPLPVNASSSPIPPGVEHVPVAGNNVSLSGAPAPLLPSSVAALPPSRVVDVGSSISVSVSSRPVPGPDISGPVPVGSGTPSAVTLPPQDLPVASLSSRPPAPESPVGRPHLRGGGPALPGPEVLLTAPLPLAGGGPSSLGAPAPPSENSVMAELAALTPLGLVPVPGPDRGGDPLVVAPASVAILPLSQPSPANAGPSPILSAVEHVSVAGNNVSLSGAPAPPPQLPPASSSPVAADSEVERLSGPKPTDLAADPPNDVWSLQSRTMRGGAPVSPNIGILDLPVRLQFLRGGGPVVPDSGVLLAAPPPASASTVPAKGPQDEQDDDLPALEPDEEELQHVHGPATSPPSPSPPVSVVPTPSVSAGPRPLPPAPGPSPEEPSGSHLSPFESARSSGASSSRDHPSARTTSGTIHPAAGGPSKKPGSPSASRASASALAPASSSARPLPPKDRMQEMYRDFPVVARACLQSAVRLCYAILAHHRQSQGKPPPSKEEVGFIENELDTLLERFDYTVENQISYEKFHERLSLMHSTRSLPVPLLLSRGDLLRLIINAYNDGHYAQAEALLGRLDAFTSIYIKINMCVVAQKELEPIPEALGKVRTLALAISDLPREMCPEVASRTTEEIAGVDSDAMMELYQKFSDLPLIFKRRAREVLLKRPFGLNSGGEECELPDTVVAIIDSYLEVLPEDSYEEIRDVLRGMHTIFARIRTKYGAIDSALRPRLTAEIARLSSQEGTLKTEQAKIQKGVTHQEKEIQRKKKADTLYTMACGGPVVAGTYPSAVTISRATDDARSLRDTKAHLDRIDLQIQTLIARKKGLTRVLTLLKGYDMSKIEKPILAALEKLAPTSPRDPTPKSSIDWSITEQEAFEFAEVFPKLDVDLNYSRIMRVTAERVLPYLNDLLAETTFSGAFAQISRILLLIQSLGVPGEHNESYYARLVREIRENQKATTSHDQVAYLDDRGAQPTLRDSIIAAACARREGGKRTASKEKSKEMTRWKFSCPVSFANFMIPKETTYVGGASLIANANATLLGWGAVGNLVWAARKLGKFKKPGGFLFDPFYDIVRPGGGTYRVTMLRIFKEATARLQPKLLREAARGYMDPLHLLDILQTHIDDLVLSNRSNLDFLFPKERARLMAGLRAALTPYLVDPLIEIVNAYLPLSIIPPEAGGASGAAAAGDLEEAPDGDEGEGDAEADALLAAVLPKARGAASGSAAGVPAAPPPPASLRGPTGGLRGGEPSLASVPPRLAVAAAAGRGSGAAAAAAAGRPSASPISTSRAGAGPSLTPLRGPGLGLGGAQMGPANGLLSGGQSSDDDTADPWDSDDGASRHAAAGRGSGAAAAAAFTLPKFPLGMAGGGSGLRRDSASLDYATILAQDDAAAPLGSDSGVSRHAATAGRGVAASSLRSPAHTFNAGGGEAAPPPAAFFASAAAPAQLGPAPPLAVAKPKREEGKEPKREEGKKSKGK